MINTKTIARIIAMELSDSLGVETSSLPLEEGAEVALGEDRGGTGRRSGSPSIAAAAPTASSTRVKETSMASDVERLWNSSPQANGCRFCV
jgi:hypothetical protein